MDEARIHDWHIDQREYDRQEQRRGRRHAYEALDPKRTALVVVDLTTVFVGEGGYALGIVPVVAGLATTVRDKGGTVAWVVPAPAAANPAFFGAAAANYATADHLPPRERLWPDLPVRQEDLLVEKSAASAFFPGRCTLHAELQARNIDTVLVAGAVTNVCCESTARDASTLGYRTIMVADANAAVSDRDHNATLHTFYRSFGDVRPAAEVVDLFVFDVRAKVTS